LHHPSLHPFPTRRSSDLDRGVLAWRATQDELAAAQHEMADLRAKREALQHRISLLDGKAIDPDLLDEVAHQVLLENRPGEVAVPDRKSTRLNSSHVAISY